jgi:hypothetical protein
LAFEHEILPPIHVSYFPHAELSLKKQLFGHRILSSGLVIYFPHS